MKATHCSWNDLEEALKIVNKRYGGNIRFNSDSDGPQRFTLRLKDSHGPGHKVSVSYVMGLDWAKKRRINAACWHVHGHFFEALFKVQPKAVVYALGRQITKNYGNWQDWNCGSGYYPVYASECCECEGEI